MRAFFPIRPRDPRARPVPYPWLGALAFSSDPDVASFAFFEDWMRFLNTSQPTPFGTGLGLQVSSSVFFYSPVGVSFSYFDGGGADARPGPHAGRLDEYLRAGWIDTNHAFGEFDGAAKFARDHAVRVYDTLGELGVALPVFTNHGTEENVQNVGTDAPYHRGDVPDDPAYHADLLKPHGTRYLWTDSLITEKPVGWKSRLASLVRRGPRKLLTARRLQDGSAFPCFTRMRCTGRYAPNLWLLRDQLDQINWRRLYRDHGAVVVYQHFGVFRKTASGCESATVPAVTDHADRCIAPLRALAERYEAGRLWVAPLARLLTYVDMVESARLQPDPSGRSIEVLLPEGGPVGPEALKGLTVYVDDPAAAVRLRCGGREVPLVRNPPDETGRPSVSVPLERLEPIW